MQNSNIDTYEEAAMLASRMRSISLLTQTAQALPLYFKPKTLPPIEWTVYFLFYTAL